MVKPLCPLANRFCGCFVWAPAPFFWCVCVCFVVVCFAVSSGETQVWLGDLRVVVVWWFCVFFVAFDFDLPAHLDQLCPCTNVFSTAYAHVRTEP